MTKKKMILSPKPVIDEAVVAMEEPDFLVFVEALFRDDDTVGLILLLDRLAGDGISLWRQTKGATIEEVTAIRDGHLLPATHKLGRVCLDSIRFHQPIVYQEGLERLARIYDLGRFRDLGTHRGESHLSWSVPTKQALAQLYVIGSYAVFREKEDALRDLLNLQAKHGYRENLVPLFSHPHFEHRSGEGDRPGFFAEALNQLTGIPSLSTLFYNGDEVTNCLCQFDFLAAYAVWRQKKNHSLNFGRYRNSRTNPIIEWLLDPEVAATLFGAFEPQRFAEFLHEIDVRCSQAFVMYNGWMNSDWTEPIRQFLQQYRQQKEEM